MEDYWFFYIPFYKKRKSANIFLLQKDILVAFVVFISSDLMFAAGFFAKRKSMEYRGQRDLWGWRKSKKRRRRRKGRERKRKEGRKKKGMMYE